MSARISFAPLDRTRQICCVILLLTGMCTILFPTIQLDTPVHGHDHWSPLDILTELQSGSLPVPASSFGSSPYDLQEGSASNWWMNPVAITFETFYLLLLLASLLMVLYPSRAVIVPCVMVAGISVLGSRGSGYTRHNLDHNLKLLFYGRDSTGFYRSAPVDHGDFSLAAMAICMLVVAILVVPGVDEIAPEPDGPLSKDLAQDVTFQLERDRVEAQKQDTE